MSGTCCGIDQPVFDGINPRYKLILWLVIGLNGALFLVEMLAGHAAGSQALQADALDFLADTLTYGISLAVIGKSLRTRATAALAKGLSLALMSAWVLGSTLWQFFVLGVPQAHVMGVVGLLALAANLASVLLLRPYKDGDANVRSVWLCSRNDAIGNLAVMAAAALVYLSGTPWPDLFVALLMSALFANSARQIFAQSLREYHTAGQSAAGQGGHKHEHPHAHGSACSRNHGHHGH